MPGNDESIEIIEKSVFSVNYIAENDIAADSVRAESFSAFSPDGEKAQVLNAFYYPMSRAIKLNIRADKADNNKPFFLTSSGLMDTGGNSADISAVASAFSEAEAEFDSVAPTALIFEQGGEGAGDIAGKSGIITCVRIANSTGTPKSGVVQITDNGVVCGEALYSVEADSVAQIQVDTLAHTFSGRENVSCRIEEN